MRLCVVLCVLAAGACILFWPVGLAFGAFFGVQASSLSSLPRIPAGEGTGWCRLFSQPRLYEGGRTTVARTADKPVRAPAVNVPIIGEPVACAATAPRPM